MIDHHYLSCKKFLLSHEFGEAGKVSYSSVIKLLLKVDLNRQVTNVSMHDIRLDIFTTNEMWFVCKVGEPLLSDKT